MRTDQWSTNQISLGELARVLSLMNSPPNVRRRPQPGDRQDRHFDQWFDGGAIATPTGGGTEYHFDDGILGTWLGLSPRLYVSVRWPDGRAVRIKQESDLLDVGPQNEL